MLTLKDPQLSQTHDVPPEGATIGREGGDADITVRSASVSKKHARLYASNGGWWLKDLGSANGTFVGKDRINKPTELKPGSVFTLSGYRFEVAIIHAEDEREVEAGATVTGLPPAHVSGRPSGSGPVFDPPPSPARGLRAVQTQPPEVAEATRLVPKGTPPAPRGAPAKVELEPSLPDLPSGESPQGELDPDGVADSTAGVAAGPATFADTMRELPRALAHYTVAVPKLLFNPLGTIRQSIDEQKFPPMKQMALMGWALPGIGLSAMVGLVCSLLLMVINGIRGLGFSISSMILTIVVAPIAALVIALLVAFLWHPIVGFVVRILGGQSDDTSRTNLLIVAQAAAILAAVPSGLGILLGGFATVRVVGPLLMIVPTLVSLGATLISVALWYFWMKFFQVHKAVPIVVLVLGALAGVFALINVGGSVRLAVKSIGSGGSSAPATLVDAQEDAKRALAGAEERAREPVREEVKDEQVKKALADADKAAEPVRVVPPVPVTAPAKAEAAPSPAHAAEAPAPGGQTPFERFAKKRDDVEKWLAADPTLLTHDPQLLTLYKKLRTLQRDAKKARAKLAAGDEVVLQRLADADLFEKTPAPKLVDELYQRLKH